jgi:hypothetical protein
MFGTFRLSEQHRRPDPDALVVGSDAIVAAAIIVAGSDQRRTGIGRSSMDCAGLDYRRDRIRIQVAAAAQRRAARRVDRLPTACRVAGHPLDRLVTGSSSGGVCDD